jgi:CheY-like chemotaxis protein/DNA-directed RNA polymerase subunit RPC12/RpoP
MNCPRCKTTIGPLSNPDSIVTCPGCGSRLMTKAAAQRSQDLAARASAATLPAPAPSPDPAPAPPVEPVAVAAPATPSPIPPPPSATLSPATAKVVGTVVARREPSPVPAGNGYEQVLRELRAVREAQERILALLEQAVSPTAARGGADEDAPALSPIRAPRRRTVLLIDDNETDREAAAKELEQADVPVRAHGDGNSALRAIAEEKPDLIVLDLSLAGDMAGKDIINVIKATMEWVDIPIVLWTHEPVANQKEARQIHGADEFVAKSAGAAALVARVITVFRRG